MDQLVLGKEWPNLKITLDSNNTTSCTDTIDIMEVDEIPDEKSAEIDEKPAKVEVKVEFMPYKEMKKYENKSNIFASGLDLMTERIQDKLGERAERFHLEANPISNTTQEEINALYKSLDIPINSDKSSDKLRGIRLDAINFRGVNDMSTEDIFDYFKDHSPSSIEWINDISCNVVWLDEKSAARALLELSRPIIIRSRKSNLEDNLDKNDKTEVSEKMKEESEVTSLEKMNEESEVTSLEKMNEEGEVTSLDKMNEEGEVTSLEKMKEEGEVVVVMSDDDMSEDEMPEHVSEKDDMKKEEKDSTISKENSSDITTKEKLDVVPIPVPPGQWRLGVSHPKAKALLLRFANKADKKIRGAEKRSLYYKKYGNPNYGGLKGIISNSRKRQFWQIQQKKELQELGVNNVTPKLTEKLTTLSNSDSENEEDDKTEHPTKRKLRMKMYADEEEVKQKKKKYLALKNNRKRMSDNRERKGSSSIEEEPENKDQFDHSESDMVADRLDHGNLSVWNRLTDKKKSDYADYSQSEDLRSKIRSRINSKSKWTRSVTPIMGDLRNKLDQIRNKQNTDTHRSPLLIHVINDQND